MQNDAAGRFIEAIEQIRKSYERRYNKTFKGFGEAWRHAGDRKDPVALRNKDLGNALGDLRNAISHASYLNGIPIAEPRSDLVEAAEKLAESVLNPVKIGRFIDDSPISIDPNSTMPEISRIISEHDFSQIPICSNGQVVNLLTTNAISRWLANSINDQGEIYEETAGVTAEHLMKYTENIDKPKYVKPNCPAYKVCDLLSSDARIPAVLVTSTGHQNSDLMGIVTAFDVPIILKKLEIKTR